MTKTTYTAINILILITSVVVLIISATINSNYRLEFSVPKRYLEPTIKKALFNKNYEFIDLTEYKS